ncbi:MAG TPA: lipase maturation factor family protein [Candidatus Acidoferrales bacterium]|nr:lipase maturation factor family protein [Candidatus Acidoferrales bacterium]
MGRAGQIINWLFGPEAGRTPGRLAPRWIFLRALGLIFFSAFYSLYFQVEGLIGPNGILPANRYLDAVSHSIAGLSRVRFVPTLFWFDSSDRALMLVCWIGMIASVLLFLNFWPRAMNLVCFICFLSFISALQDFSSYQSDGMLLEASFLCLFYAPFGLRPRWGELSPPSRAAHFLLLWEWFRIYFESGSVKLLGGDPEWRHLTAMYEYYQNGPLPTWIGWYVQHLPLWFHWATALATLVMELGIVLFLFLPRRFRLICFFIVTPWEIAVILTANYAFLNYIVLALGFLLLDDRFITAILPTTWFPRYRASVARLAAENQRQLAVETSSRSPISLLASSNSAQAEKTGGGKPLDSDWRAELGWFLKPAQMAVAGFCLLWVFYASTTLLVWMFAPEIPLPRSPVEVLEPFRIADQYGLFAIMTRGRYEIEFQGSNDNGQTWTTYPFRNKPQALNEAPRICAPYQPRFDWNLWFASLGNWREFPFVVKTEEALLDGSPEVIKLFASNPFRNAPPKEIRAVIWQYWFTDMATKSATGNWWRRELIGLYAPTLVHMQNGKYGAVQFPEPLPEHHD